MFATRNLEVSVTLPSDTEISFTCVFQRKRQTMFEAWSRAEHIRNWWGCDAANIQECKVDFRVGGSWEISLTMPDASHHLFRGTYREIVNGERIVFTERYEAPHFGNPEFIVTVLFEEVDGGVRLTHTVRHPSREARDKHLQAGMETGTIQMFHRFDKTVDQISTENGRF